MVGAALALAACTGGEPVPRSLATPDSTVALAEGEVLVNIFTESEGDYTDGISANLIRPNGWLAFIAETDMADWWTKMVGDPAFTIPNPVEGIDVETTERVLAATAAILSRTGSNGVGQVGLEPGDYLVCAIGSTRDRLPLVRNCANLTVDESEFYLSVYWGDGTANFGVGEDGISYDRIIFKDPTP